MTTTSASGGPATTGAGERRLRLDERRLTVVAVGAATFLLYAVLAIWACVTPPFRAPDEPQHVSTVLRLAYDHTYPAAGTARLYPAVKGAEPALGFHIVGDFLDTSPEKAAPASERGPETLRQLATQAGPYTLKDFDQMTQHPPGYYAVVAVPTRVFDLLDLPARDALVLMRLFSAALLLPLPYLVFRLTRDLGGSAALSRGAAFLPAALPQFTHIGAAVNNDVLTITLASLLTVQAVELASRGATLKRGVWFGLGYLALLLTKGMALPLGVLVVGAYLLSARRFGWRPAVRPFIATAAISCVGLAWWVANVVRFGTLQPDGYPPAWLRHLPHGHTTFSAWFTGFFDVMARSFWLDLGWLEMSPPRWAYVGASILVLLLVGVAVLRAGRYRAVLVMAQLSWLAVMATIFQQSHAAWVARSTLAGTQGRYLFPGIAAMAAAVALGSRRRQDALHRRRPARSHAVGAAGAAALPLLVVLAAVAGLERGVHHFYVGSTLWSRLQDMSTWSPLRLRDLAAIGTVAVVAAVVGGLAQWRAVRDAAGGRQRSPAVLEQPRFDAGSATEDHVAP